MAYNISEKDFIKAQWIHIKPRPIYAIIGIIILFTLELACANMVWKCFDENIFAKILIPIGINSYLVILVCNVLRKWHKIYKQTKSLQNSISISYENRTITFITESGHNNVKIDDIYKIKSSSDLMLIYLNEMMFIVVKKSDDEVMKITDAILIDRSNRLTSR